MRLQGPLASAAWLSENAHADGLVIADVRWSPQEGTPAAIAAYEAGHIPGSVFLDLDRDLAATPFTGLGGRHPLPSPESFARTMAARGVADDTLVVTYDDVRGSIAARLWWMLDITGHPAAVLDGGLEGWPGPIARGPEPVALQPAAFTAQPWPPWAIASAGDVANGLRGGAVAVLDARAEERYRAETEPIDPVAGHVPGAVNAPWTDSVDPGTGRFLSPDRLRERFAEVGARDASRVIVHCGSGVTSCHHALAMRLAGIGRPRLYVGSWSDWVSDPTRPVVTGPDPGTLPGSASE